MNKAADCTVAKLEILADKDISPGQAISPSLINTNSRARHNNETAVQTACGFIPVA